MARLQWLMVAIVFLMFVCPLAHVASQLRERRRIYREWDRAYARRRARHGGRL